MIPAIERFLEKISVSETNFYKDTPCWEWTASKNTDGYGHISIGDGMMPTHRFISEYYNGEIDPKLEIDHLCRNRVCANILHLEAVSHKVNVLRGNGLATINKCKTHCKRGHEFTKENTIKGRSDARHCRECHNVSVRKYEISHRTQTNITKQKYREKNRDRVNEQARKYYEKYKDLRTQKARERWAENREELCKKQQEYRQKNPEKMKDYDRNRYKKRKLLK